MSMRNRNKTAKGRKSSRVLAIMMAAVFSLSSLGTALPAYADGDTAQTAEAAQEQEKAATASAGETQQESTSTGKTGEEQPAQDQNSSEPEKQKDIADTQNSAEASSQEQVTSEEPAQEKSSEKPAQEETSSEESAQKEATTEESATEEAAEEEEQDKAYEQSVTVTEDNGKLTVTAKAAAGVLPENAQLSVKPVTKGSDYTDIEKKVQEDTEAQEKELLGFLAYDISFSADGEEIEPSGNVDVTMDWADAAAPDGIENSEAEVTVLHLEDADSGKIKDTEVVDLTKSKDENNTASVKTQGDENAVSKVQMTVGQFSVFTLVWWDNTRSITIKYVDEDGQELNVTQSAFDSATNRTETKYLIYDIDGYEYSYAYINRKSEYNRILPVLYRRTDGGWACYYTYNLSRGYLDDKDTVYVVYKEKTSPTQGGTPSTTTSGDRPSSPTVKKESTDNGNGTREIALSITGSEADSTEKAKADVIVILDTSGSMQYDLNRNNGSSNGRLNAAKRALDTLADTLLTNNNNDAVRLSLLTFSDTAAQPYGFTSSNSAFKNYYRNLSASGATNWEDALATANRMSVRSDAATYVIFVTDGDPTFRNSRGNYTDKQIEDYNEDRAYDDNLKNNTRDVVFGDGNNDRNNANHNAALAEAKSIVSHNKNFYTIGIGPSVGDLQQFTSSLGLAASGTDSHYFSALNNSALTYAFKKIASTITTKLGFANVRMTDGITPLTNLSAKVGDDATSGFTYTMTDKNGDPMTVPDNLKTAKYDADSGSVVWNLPANYQLEDGVTYKVEFTVWPSQEALDHVAKLNNGTESYGSLANDVKAQIVQNTDGTYSLKTNDKTQNVLVQNSTSVGGSAATEGADIELKFGEVPNLTLQDAEVTVQKKWSGVTPSASSDLYKGGVSLTISDGTSGGVHKNLTVRGADWSGSAHISAGFALSTDGGLNVLESGHDFTITESTLMSAGWTLSAGTYRPMIIDGTLTMLRKGTVEGAATYTIGNDTYSAVGQTDGKYILEATNTAKNISVKVKKQWNDNDNQDGKRPGSVVVHLYANGQDTGKSVTLTDADNWKEKSFTDLTIYDENGQEITYTVVEDSVDGYTGAVTGNATDGFTITNTHTPLKTKVEAEKVWNDNNNQDGIRPANSDIGVTLYANGEWQKSAKLDDTGKVVFDNLDAYKNGVKINYTVSETNVPAGYTSEVSGNAESGFTITNTHTPNTISVTVNKHWDDVNDQDGKRPDHIDVQLYKGDEAQGEKVRLDNSHNWTYTWTGLAQKSGGKAIDYTVKEDVPDGYEETVKESGSGDNIVVDITNRHDPETFSISGEKTWDDDDDRDGLRPAEINVTLTGTADTGDNISVVYKQSQIVRADAAGKWEYSFTDLPKYNSGTAITYAVTEEPVAGYETTVDGYNITNTHTPETTTVSGTKTWDDKNDQDGKRPEKVTVELFANGVKVKEQNVSADASGNWNYSFTGLPKYENGGSEIIYSIAESRVEGYTSTVSDYNITNSYTPEQTSVEVIKRWDDADDQDGVRPDSVKVSLLADGKDTGKTVTLSAANNWSASFTGLAKNNGGTEINYTVSEIQVNGYAKPTVAKDPASGAFIITNTHTPDTVAEISGTKTWNDGNNQDGIRPDSIKVILTGTADGQIVSEQAQDVTPDKNGTWTYSWSSLPANHAGKKITYTVSEQAVPGYTTSVDGYNITNTHTPETIAEISGTKTWDDGNDQDGIRPKSITVVLTGTVGENKVSEYTKPVKPDDNGDWTYTFNNLPKYSSGKEITYTVSEKKVDGYTTEITGHNITNTHTPETTTVSGTKTWDDDNDRDGIRPKEITVTLTGKVDGKEVYTKTQDFTANAQGEWNYIFEDVPKNSGGKQITYTVSEKSVEGYTTEIKGLDITNTHTPETTSVAGTKTWDDNNNRTGNRPAAVTVTLYANGEKVDSRQVSAGSGWTYSFTGLKKYENGGNLINYTVTESSVKNYSLTKVDGYNLTNTYTPDKTSVSVVKRWDDSDNQDGKRPETVNVYLYANGRHTGKTLVLDEESNWEGTFPDLDVDQDGKPITYSVKEYQVEGYGEPVYTSDDEKKNFVITNKRTPEKISVSGTKTWNDNDNQDNKRPDHVYVTLTGKVGGTEVYATTKKVTPNDKGEWNYSWENLDRYKDGTEIVYSVSEVPVEGYTAEVTGCNITNTHTPEKVETISGTKTWDDNDDSDGRRPSDITVYITGKAGDQTVYTGSQKVTADQTGAWEYSFSGLDKYYQGEEIQYTVSEDPVSGYTATVDGNDITNTHTPETVAEISGTKIWNDSNNQDGKRPSSVTVELFANGAKKDSRTITAADNWKYSFTDLPKYENGGKLISYTVAEASVEGYSSEVTGYNITNSYTPGKTSVEVIKRWDDNDNQDGKRPGSVTVHLYADDADTGKTATLSAANNWSAQFTGLDLNKDGKAISYTVSEDQVPDYETSVVTENAGIFIITNKHTPETHAEISGTKTWNDGDNQDGIRPDSIKVFLTGTAGGRIVFEEDVTVTAESNWKYSFTNLPKYDSGTEITYAVTEEPVAGYVTTVDEKNNITNTHTPETIAEISGTKIWNDSNNQDGKRPDKVTVELFANGVKVNEQNVSADASGNWNYSFTDLPKYENGGKEIVYSIAESQVDDYSSEVSGYDITNSYTPGKTSVEVIKHWDDNDDQDGLRPDKVEVSLLADGADTGRKVTLSAANNWSAQFTELPEYSNGNRIKYTVSEEQVQDYETPDVTEKDGIFIITNKHITGTVTVSGTKTWDDADNQDGKRPDSITVRLLADGEEVQSRKVTAEDDWTYNFTDLTKNKEGGKAITYTVTEDAVKDYTTSVDGYNITNSYTPGKTGVTVTKVWDDGDNRDGKRPDSITVRLYADGSYTGKEVRLSADNNWSVQFTDLDVNKSGKAVSYTVGEVKTEGYKEPVITGNAQTGYMITNTYTPETVDISGTKTWNDDNDRDGKRPDSITVRLLADGEEVRSAEVTAQTDWKYSFTGLPKNEGGKAITYTVREDAVDGYTATIKGYDITNTYTPEMISVAGQKIWNDNNDQDGKRPAGITVHLRLNGEIIDTRTVSASDGWKYSFTNLPKYENGGHLINYTVTENTTEDYSSTVGGYNITNSYTPGRTSVTVVKDWDDRDDQDGQRPDSVTIHLYADGEDTGRTVTLDASNKWEAEFTDLDEYQGGQKIAYTVSEDQVTGYEEPVITGNAEEGFVITNSRIYGTVSVSGTKTWDDADNQDGKRPDSITVRLLADGEEVQSAQVTEKEDWQYSFTDLPQYQGGSEIVYTVTEDTVEGYTSAVDGYNITNSYTPGETGITVTKRWDDGNDRDGIRPDSITVRLLADGADTGNSVTLSAANNWSAQFTGLALNKDGKAISYTVSEDQVSGYEKPVITGDAEKGFVITNTHTPKAQPEEPNGKDKPSGSSGGKPSGSSGNKSSGTGSNGSNSTGSSSGTRSGSSAKTGDTANITLYLILMIAAAGVLVGLIRKKK